MVLVRAKLEEAAAAKGSALTEEEATAKTKVLPLTLIDDLSAYILFSLFFFTPVY